MGLLVVVLSLKLNHAMAALTAVATTFVAAHLDAYSHAVGRFVLTHPEFREVAARAWQYPVVPWSDLNNTVVMGSFLIGSAAVVPLFCLAYPVFRLLAPRGGQEELAPDPDPAANAAESGRVADSSGNDRRRVVIVEDGHRQVVRPHRIATPQPASAAQPAAANDSSETGRPAAEDFKPLDPPAGDAAIETRIDVIRLKDYRSESASDPAGPTERGADQPPMDEALNFLLRQLRDTQGKDAA